MKSESERALLSFSMFLHPPSSESLTPMWRTAVVLQLGLLLAQLQKGGGTVTVFSRAGERGVSLPCWYSYEDGVAVSRLSVQWRSPGGELRCHYIKHKAFHNCSDGYHMAYRPGNITLTVRHVRPRDFGTHVCSVSKPHHFSDFSVELVRMEESFTTARTGGVSRSGTTWRLLLLQAFTCVFISM